jgi:hypothetical protein
LIVIRSSTAIIVTENSFSLIVAWIRIKILISPKIIRIVIKTKVISVAPTHHVWVVPVVEWVKTNKIGISPAIIEKRVPKTKRPA